MRTVEKHKLGGGRGFLTPCTVPCSICFKRLIGMLTFQLFSTITMLNAISGAFPSGVFAHLAPVSFICV